MRAALVHQPVQEACSATAVSRLLGLMHSRDVVKPFVVDGGQRQIALGLRASCRLALDLNICCSPVGRVDLDQVLTSLLAFQPSPH